MSIRTRATVLALVLGAVASTTSTQAFAQAPARGAAPPATAQATPPAPTLTATLTGGAKGDYESGKVLFGDGDHAGALVKFSSAYEKSQDPRLLWNMAACEKNLRHYSRSLKLVRRYLAEGADKLEPQDKVDAEELVKVMEPLTAKLVVTVNEPGADVSVDEEPAGTSPVPPIVVDIGSRRLRVRKEGFEEQQREVPVGGSSEIRVDVALAKIVREGRLTVRAPEKATIAVDEKIVGTGSYVGVLPSGGHTLRVTEAGKRPYQTEVIVQDKQTREVSVTLEPEQAAKGGGLPAWAWIAGGVLVTGGLVTGGALLFSPDATYNGPAGNLQGGIAQANRGFWR